MELCCTGPRVEQIGSNANKRDLFLTMPILLEEDLCQAADELTALEQKARESLCLPALHGFGFARQVVEKESALVQDESNLIEVPAVILAANAATFFAPRCEMPQRRRSAEFKKNTTSSSRRPRQAPECIFF